MIATTTKPDRVDWLQCGREHWEDNQSKILDAIADMQWQPIPCEMSFCGGEGIKAAIEQLRIPNVTAAAESNHLAPYGLLGVCATYINADIRAYWADEGSKLVGLCVEVFEKVQP